MLKPLNSAENVTKLFQLVVVVVGMPSLSGAAYIGGESRTPKR